jgi:hypothetical protein
VPARQCMTGKSRFSAEYRGDQGKYHYTLAAATKPVSGRDHPCVAARVTSKTGSTMSLGTSKLVGSSDLQRFNPSVGRHDYPTAFSEIWQMVRSDW